MRPQPGRVAVTGSLGPERTVGRRGRPWGHLRRAGARPVCHGLGRVGERKAGTEPKGDKEVERKGRKEIGRD